MWFSLGIPTNPLCSSHFVENSEWNAKDKAFKPYLQYAEPSDKAFKPMLAWKLGLRLSLIFVWRLYLDAVDDKSVKPSVQNPLVVICQSPVPVRAEGFPWKIPQKKQTDRQYLFLPKEVLIQLLLSPSGLIKPAAKQTDHCNITMQPAWRFNAEVFTW